MAITQLNLDIIGRLLQRRPGTPWGQTAKQARRLFTAEPCTAGLIPTEIRVNPVHRSTLPTHLDGLPVVYSDTVRRQHLLICCPDPEINEPD